MPRTRICDTLCWKSRQIEISKILTSQTVCCAIAYNMSFITILQLSIAIKALVN